jgi:hypothetical protein
MSAPVGTAIGDRLLDCLHQDPARTERLPWADVTVDEWAALFGLARTHHVDALLAYRLRSRGVEGRLPDAARTAALDARRRGARSALLVQETLTRLTSALQARGVSVIVLKGAHLAHVVYPHPSLRWMLDVDLLVQQADLARAAVILRAHGCRQLAQSDDEGGSSAYPWHLPRFVQAHPPSVELHWRLAASDLPPRNDLWQRAVPLRIGGVDTLGLCPEDLLLHLCVHASYAHRFAIGLRAICDIAETVRHFGGTLAWAAFEERARRHHWHRGVYLMLRLASEMLGAAVPDEVLRARPSGDLDHALRTSRFLILEGNQIGRGLPSGVASVTSATTWPARVRVLWRSLFVPSAALARDFRLPPDSSRVLLYSMRVKDLLKRHGSLVVRLLRRDPAVTPIARDVATIQQWLSDDDRS